MSQIDTKASEITEAQRDANRLKYLREEALSEVRSTAKQLYIKLEAIKRDVDLAVSRMLTGSLPYGGQYGPIGNQANVDVVILTERLARHIETCRIAGASEQDVNKAYNDAIAQVA